MFWGMDYKWKVCLGVDVSSLFSPRQYARGQPRAPAGLSLAKYTIAYFEGL